MTLLNPWPEHQNPTPTREDRIASAPYNFVPLPEKVIVAYPDAQELPNHNTYYPDRLSGYFDVTLTTRSPLYIRGPVPAKDFPRQESDQDVKNRPTFFHTGDERRPVIPGSSLRGMLRSLLEIVSYGKMQWVSEKQLFFRTVDDTAIGKYYNHRLVEESGDIRSAGNPLAPGYHARVEGGFFRAGKDGTYFIEECTVARVETADLLQLFGLANPRDLYQLDGKPLNDRNERNPNQMPSWSYQHREIWADIDGTERDYFFPKQFTIDRNNRRRLRHPDLYLRFRRARNLATTSVGGKQSGKLVLTGHMNFKHLAFLFVPSQGTIRRLKVPNDPREQDPNKRLVDHFHDDDQLTPWQKKAFPVDRKPSVKPKEDGHLRDGDPVFFLRDENGNLVFFGRAQMFRLPYKQRPIDLVPPELRKATDIDYAEALFGFVRTPEQGTHAPRQGDKRRAYAGRVSITNAVLQPDQENIWLADDFDLSITPRILATPKPTAFQQYLTQQHPDDRKNLDHYDSVPPGSDETTIRGHKLYWHQGLDTDQDLNLEQIRTAIEDPVQPGPGDTQHTRFKPLKPGVQFSFRVYFENLSDRELGALCWTLHPHGDPGQRYCHHLGMGKPLGMGAVELHAHLHIINRRQRYGTLFNGSGDNWQLGEDSTVENLTDPEVLAHRTKPFEKHLLHELNLDPSRTRLADLLRIAMLLKLLEWPGYRAEEGDRYLEARAHPNTRYMTLNEFRGRPVLPDPRQFNEPYFKNKLRPQDTQALALPPELAEQFPIGRELRNMTPYAESEQGVEVAIWNRDPRKVIGFIPRERIDRKLGNQISGIVTGLRQGPDGRLIVELKLRERR